MIHQNEKYEQPFKFIIYWCSVDHCKECEFDLDSLTDKCTECIENY